MPGNNCLTQADDDLSAAEEKQKYDFIMSVICDGKYSLSGEDLLETINSIISNFNLNDILETVALFIDQLDDAIKHLDQNFPKTLVFIVNTKNNEILHQTGTNHWFCFIRSRNGDLFSFDSYGRPLDEILATAGIAMEKDLKATRSVSPQRLQNGQSVVCGQYVIQFVLFLAESMNVFQTWLKFQQVTIPIQENLFPSMQDIDHVTAVNDYVILQKINNTFPKLQ